MSTQGRTLFSLGQIVATPRALDALRHHNSTGLEYLRRHASGDWGFVDDEDKQANDKALETGARLLSAYFLPDETKLWIVTDAQDGQGNRQATTFMLPDDY